MSDKPVYCRIKDVYAITAIKMLQRGVIYLKMPDGEMQQVGYQLGMGHAIKHHVRAFPHHRYYIKTSQ